MENFAFTYLLFYANFIGKLFVGHVFVGQNAVLTCPNLWVWFRQRSPSTVAGKRCPPTCGLLWFILFLLFLRCETRSTLRMTESGGVGDFGERTCGVVLRCAGRSHSREESLHFRGLQLSARGGTAEVLQRGGHSGSRGHPGERAQRKSSGPRTQHTWDGSGGGSGLLCTKAGAVPFQSEVQTLLPAEGRRRGRYLRAQETGWRSSTGQWCRSDSGWGLSDSTYSSQKTEVMNNWFSLVFILLVIDLIKTQQLFVGQLNCKLLLAVVNLLAITNVSVLPSCELESTYTANISFSPFFKMHFIRLNVCCHWISRTLQVYCQKIKMRIHFSGAFDHIILSSSADVPSSSTFKLTWMRTPKSAQKKTESLNIYTSMVTEKTVKSSRKSKCALSRDYFVKCCFQWSRMNSQVGLNNHPTMQ